MNNEDYEKQRRVIAEILRQIRALEERVAKLEARGDYQEQEA